MGTRGHCLYALRYEYGFLTRGGVPCLSPQMLRRAEEICRELAPNFDIEIQRFSGSPCHIHIVVECEPITELTKFANSIKTVTSRRLRQEFGSKLPTSGGLWAHSYAMRTVSNGKKMMEDYLG